MQKIINELKNNKIIYISLFFIIILGTGLRLYNLGENSFVADEFLDVNATYGYFKTGEWQAWDFNQDKKSVRENQASDERAWIYRWQVAQIYRFLEPTEFNIRLVSALWGILTIFILYFIVFNLTKNRWIALTSAFLFAISIPALEINRKIRMYSMFAPIFLLFSWSFFRFLETSKKKTENLISSFFNFNWWYFLPTLILALLSLHLHPLAGNIVLVAFVYILFQAFFNFQNEKKINRYFLYILIGIFAFFFFKIFAENYFNWFASTLTFFENHYSYFNHINLNFENALFGWFLILLGSWNLLRKSENFKGGLWIVCNFWVIFISAIFLWKRNVGQQYIFFIQTFALILVASGISVLVNFIVNSLKFSQNKISYLAKIKNENSLILFITLFFLIFTPNYTYFLAENNTFHSTSDSENPNYRKIFTYFRKNVKKEDVLITRNLRNYYLNDLKIPVFDFGSERDEESLEKEGKVKKLTLNYIQEIVVKNPSGWVIFSDNDENFIEKEALNYFEQNFTKIKATDSLLVKGKVSVYKWEKN